MFRTTFIGHILLFLIAFAFTVFFAGCVAKPPSIDGVFLIVVDTLRPDRLSCYGYEGHRTEAIDGLAASGVRFENAQSSASWTLPAMGSVLTSRYPTELGLVERSPEEPRLFGWREKRSQVAYTLPDGVPTLASLLDDAGFYPVAFVNQPFINAGSGFLQGFAEWCYTVREDSIAWHDPQKPMPVVVYPPNTDLGMADNLLVEAFGRWLASNADRHPFVWVHLLRPHSPYTPLLRYLPDSLQHQGADVPPEVAYTAEVRESDDLVRGLLASIDSTVGRKHALIVFVSDHGEEFGEHLMAEHGHSLHHEVVHVPLILTGPSLPAGKVIHSDASILDLTPTVLDLVGALDKAPKSLEGRSLLPLIRRDTGGRTLYMEGMLYGSTERSVLQDGYKLMFDAQGRPPYALFDATRDPGETRNVLAEQPDRAAAMEKMLNAHVAHVTDGYAAIARPSTAKDSVEIERILDAMRTLGYVNR